MIAIRRSTDGARIVECILGLGLVDRATGEAQRLQESLSAALKDRVAVAG